MVVWESRGPFEIYDTRVSINETIGVIGDTVDIPIYISPMTTSLQVLSLQATISYDSSIMHAIGIINTGTVSSGWTFSANISGNQTVFAGAGSSPLSGSGILCKMRFVVPAYATSGSSNGIYFQQFMFNEGKPRAQTINGSITISSVGLPATPTNLNAVAVNYGRIDLSWQDNATNETGYTLQRTSDTTSTWSTLQVFAANTTTDSDSGLIDGTKYFYRVFASNTGGNSGFSNVSSAITPMRPPTTLTAAQIAGEKIKLTWQDNSSTELGYYIERKLGSSGTYAVLDSVGANATTFTDSTGTPGNKYFYRVRGYNSVVTSAYSNEVNLTLTGIKSDRPGVPDKFDVSQNYPNPFNPSTKITYQLSAAGHVTLKIFDALGREVATLVNENLAAGYYDATFNADRLPSGIYLYRLTANGYVSVKKMLMIK